MAEFSVDAFTNRLIQLMYDKFPLDTDAEMRKHGRTEHLRDAVFNVNDGVFDTIVTQNMESRSFEIGSPILEAKRPAYHILESAPTIRKRGRGSEKTKGSQENITNPMERDYERVSFNGKTYSKEYSRNVRGQRMSKATDYRYKGAFVQNGKVKYTVANANSNSYVNVHYQYIEKMLNGSIVDQLASEFGLKKQRVQSTGLEEEYLDQQMQDIFNTIDMLNSMSEEE